MLQDLFLNSNLPQILENIQPFFSPQHFYHLVMSLNSFLLCADYNNGYVTYSCSCCGTTHKFPITCKTRLCPSCGYKYSKNWANRMSRDLLNVPHRHVLFTIPKECREFFCYDRTLLHKLAYGVKQIFDYQFHNMKAKKDRQNKIGRYSKHYFTNSDIVHYGLVTVTHTFGRDLKWNPHIHALVSLGGFTKKLIWKKRNYFHIDAIANQWRYMVLSAVVSGVYPNERILKKAKKIVTQLYKRNVRLFFSVGDYDVNSPEGLIKYLGRYLARSPIADYKIREVTEDSVTFFYEDLAKNKEKTYVTLSREEFIQKVLIHFPPKHFRMIHRFGFYARNKTTALKSAMHQFKKPKKQKLASFYVASMWATFKINPFVCPNCHIPMRKKELYIAIRWYGRKYQLSYFSKA